MSKSWQIYALHILDVGAKIDRIQASVVKNHLPPLIDSVRAMLAADGPNLN